MATSAFFFFSSFIKSLSILKNRDARVLFKAGKNRDGWFGSEDLIAQVDRAIDIFDGLTKGYAQALFLFDNAPSHQKRAPDAISARKMIKGALLSDLFLFFSNSRCTHRTKGWLDAPLRWATHARWQTPEWRNPVILLPSGAPHHAWMVQGHGGNHSRTRLVAGRWLARTMYKFPLPSWKN